MSRVIVLFSVIFALLAGADRVPRFVLGRATRSHSRRANSRLHWYGVILGDPDFRAALADQRDAGRA